MAFSTNRPKKRAAVGTQRQWFAPVVLLMATTLLLFFALYAVDHVMAGGSLFGNEGVFSHYLSFDSGSITDAVSSLAGTIAAVFGIVVTVVSIVVQLSADRFAGVTRMFLRDRLNLTVMGYYVVTCVCGVWFSVSVQTGFVPRVALVAMLVVTTLGIVLMAPFFGYVFWFLEPRNVVERIRREALGAVHWGAFTSDAAEVDLTQARAVTALEELTDVANRSISNQDKIIASAAVDAIKDFVIDYLSVKPGPSAPFRRLGPTTRKNPDFVAMDPESLSDLEARGTWIEWKAMRQYLGIYNESLGTMRDINYLIAIDTRYLGEAAGSHHDTELLKLVFRYLNSYLRATINQKDVRTAYNVLNQYRLLVEAMIRQGHEEQVVEAVRFLNYYGHVCFDTQLTFVTETIAYDVATLCQVAHEQRSRCQDRLLESFLELDRPMRSRRQEQALLGVRKAQVKLAAYYLTQGAEAPARLICEDMRHEPKERLTAIRAALEGVTSKDFWEITDRGRNFEYMPDTQRSRVREFFGWLGIEAVRESDQTPPPPSSAAISSSS